MWYWIINVIHNIAAQLIIIIICFNSNILIQPIQKNCSNNDVGSAWSFALFRKLRMCV